MREKRSNHDRHHRLQGTVMDSMSFPDLQQSTPNLNFTSNPCAITINTNIDSHVAGVDKLELESLTRRRAELAHALDNKQEANGAQLTTADIERRVDATEFARRIKPITIINASGAAELLSLSSLPNSYRTVRNLLWIEHHPVYRTALAEWRRQVPLFASRVERKIKRILALKNEIYNVLGFYSVFQGVLLTATSQSNYLHCPNVGLPIALSSFASLCTLVHIWRKFRVITGLQKTISDEQISLKEAKSRIHALKNNGEAFRFSDFLEDKETRCTDAHPRRLFMVPLVMIFLFSVVFAIAHWLILCRPGHKMRYTKFINGTSSEITLKEANSGIQRVLFKLAKVHQANSSYEMELDSNATYREYHLYVIPSCNAGSVIVSSDDLADNTIITIMEVDPGVFSWNGTPRKSEATKKRKPEVPRNKLKRWLSNFLP